MSVSVEAASVGEEMAQIFDAGDEPTDELMPDDVDALATTGLVEPKWAS